VDETGKSVHLRTLITGVRGHFCARYAGRTT